MATDLASIISGTDPLAPLEMRALQQYNLGQSVRDASQWQNQGFLGALGRTLGSFSANNTDALQQIAAQRSQALPTVFQALASGNPYQWGANNPSASPVALASVLANAPAAAKALYEGSAAGLNINNLASLQALSKLNQNQPPGTAAPIPNAAIVNKAPVIAPSTTPAGPSTDVMPLINGIISAPPGTPMPQISAQQRIAIMNAIRNNPELFQKMKQRFAAPTAPTGQ